MNARKRILKARVYLRRRQRRLIRHIVDLFGRFRKAEQIFMIIAAIIIGVMGAFAAIIFRSLIDFLELLAFQAVQPTAGWIAGLPWWHRLFLPACGGLLVGLVIRYVSREVRGSGVPEVMEAVAVHGGAIRPRVILAKLTAAALTIGSGGSAGREGPIVQISSALGSWFGQILSLSAKRIRGFVACGAAAGIAATFNAPIAGALFAIEVIVGDLAVAHFSPIVISSVVATIVSRIYLGNFPAFQIPAYELVSPLEFIPYTLLGILAGFTAILLIQAIYRTQNIFENLAIPEISKPALGGLIVGILGLVFPQVYGVGYQTINTALWGENIGWILLLIVGAKIIATGATIGSGGSGGIFAPSLLIGALLGSVIGQQMHQLYPDISGGPGAYALVGMGAVVAGATHAPISAILVLFELTNDYHIIPPLMVSCILAVVISTYLKRESIYTLKLVRRGLNIYQGRDINLMRGIKVSEITRTDIEMIPSDDSFTDIIRRILQSNHQDYFVVNRKEELVGVISLRELKLYFREEAYLSSLVIAADLAHPPPAILYQDDNLDLVMHHFGRFNVDELPVLASRSNRRLIGAVLRKDVFEAYNQEIFKWDLAGGMHSVVTAASKERMIELAEGYSIVEIDPPDGFIGKSIKDLNIRARYGIEVLMIRQTVVGESSLGSRQGALPTPDYLIQPGDRLLVMGSKKDIRYLRKGGS